MTRAAATTIQPGIQSGIPTAPPCGAPVDAAAGPGADRRVAADLLLRWPRAVPLAALVSGGDLHAQNTWSIFARPKESVVIPGTLAADEAVSRLEQALQRTPRIAPARSGLAARGMPPGQPGPTRPPMGRGEGTGGGEGTAMQGPGGARGCNDGRNDGNDRRNDRTGMQDGRADPAVRRRLDRRTRLQPRRVLRAAGDHCTPCGSGAACRPPLVRGRMVPGSLGRVAPRGGQPPATGTGPRTGPRTGQASSARQRSARGERRCDSGWDRHVQRGWDRHVQWRRGWGRGWDRHVPSLEVVPAGA